MHVSHWISDEVSCAFPCLLAWETKMPGRCRVLLQCIHGTGSCVAVLGQNGRGSRGLSDEFPHSQGSFASYYLISKRRYAHSLQRAMSIAINGKLQNVTSVELWFYFLWWNNTRRQNIVIQTKSCSSCWRNWIEFCFRTWQVHRVFLQKLYFWTQENAKKVTCNNAVTCPKWMSKTELLRQNESQSDQNPDWPKTRVCTILHWGFCYDRNWSCWDQ